jgi:putative endonuclease
VAWFVYIVTCADGSLYTGIARDVQARLAAHADGKGARYTRGRGPLTLAAKTRCGSQGEALRLERAVKALPRARKLRLIAAPGRLPAFARRWRADCARRASVVIPRDVFQR